MTVWLNFPYSLFFQMSCPVYWREIREDYDALCQLCRHVDDVLSDLIVVSYVSNLSFILVQLFNSLKYTYLETWIITRFLQSIAFRQIQTTIEGIYFFFSFGFLIIRTVTVSVYASWINEESKGPLIYLNSLPSQLYNSEVVECVFHAYFSLLCKYFRSIDWLHRYVKIWLH